MAPRHRMCAARADEGRGNRLRVAGHHVDQRAHASARDRVPELVFLRFGRVQRQARRLFTVLEKNRAQLCSEGTDSTGLSLTCSGDSKPVNKRVAKVQPNATT
jgi:hypothetical protein